ncbi:hypothetical protein GCM10009680_85050 [Streptomyces yatensis]|uniref:Uncharacterized protein n=1 Tax=Streptomyces yatensis TaxID=155177 RepID=A0ABN2JL12_9ACTN
MSVTEHLAELVRGLDAGWKQLAERLEEAGPAAKVSIEVQDDGRVKLNVDKLGALGEPKSLTWLRQRVEKMLPKIDLPDLLFEVNAWTGFLDAFVHLGDGTTRMKRPAHLGGRAAGVRGVQHRPDPGGQPRLRGPDPGPARARRPVLPARRHHRRRERAAHRRPGRHPDRAVLG